MATFILQGIACLLNVTVTNFRQKNLIYCIHFAAQCKDVSGRP